MRNAQSAGRIGSPLALAAVVLACGCAAPPATPSADGGGPLPKAVAFDRGAEQFASGDRITITSVRGTAADVSAGNVYCVRGTYTLASHDRATIAAFTTAATPAGGGPTLKVQSTDVARGSGSFTLYQPIGSDGWPHVSFYPAGGGDSFGGAYYGTGATVYRAD